MRAWRIGVTDLLVRVKFALSGEVDSAGAHLGRATNGRATVQTNWSYHEAKRTSA